MPLGRVGLTPGAVLRRNHPWRPWDLPLRRVGIASVWFPACSGGKSHGTGNLAPHLTCGFLNRPCGIRLWSLPTVGITPGARGIRLWSCPPLWESPLEPPDRGNRPWSAWNPPPEPPSVGIAPGACRARESEAISDSLHLRRSSRTGKTPNPV